MSRALLRPARQEDQAAVASLHQRSVRELCRTHYDAAELAEWTSALASADYGALLEAGPAVVACSDADVVGFGLVDLDGGLVRAVYVDPAWPGRGVGGLILDWLEALAREAGCEALRLHATLNAVGFYLRAGYTNDGPGENRLPSGVLLRCAMMSKTLVDERRADHPRPLDSP